MISNNIFQWNEHYPNIATFKNDLKEESLYVIEKNEKVIGCIVMSQIMDEFYQNVELDYIKRKRICIYIDWLFILNSKKWGLQNN